MGKNSIPALERAISIMQTLADGGPVTSIGLARRLGISQSSCYRILQTLIEAGWIAPGEDGGYVFSVGLLPFVKPLLGVERAVERLRPLMEELAATTRLTVKLSMRQGTDQVTVGRVESPRPLSVSSPVGARFPVVLGASGACLLADFDETALQRQIAQADEEALWGHESSRDLRARITTVRKEGICGNLGHHPQGIDTLSVPVVMPGQVFAMTLIGLRGDFHDQVLPDLRQRLLNAAASQSLSNTCPVLPTAQNPESVL